MLKKLFQIFSQNKLATFVILTGSAIWSLTMVKSGFPYPYGLGFWGPNGHDGVWHIALGESLVRGSSEMPTFAGEGFQNYHIGFSLILSFLNKLTGIPISILYFQIIPPLLGLLIGLMSYRVVLSWTKSKQAATWSTFFIYFGGSFGWLVSLLRGGEIGGESMFWSQQALSTLINPPFAFSLVILLLGINILIKERKSRLDYVLSAFCFGVLIQIKVYAGILSLGALFASGLWKLFREKKTDLLLMFAGSLAISLLLFIPFNRNPQSLLVFQPFWFLETMMGFTDRLNWARFYSAMTNYRMGGVWLKGIPAYLAAFLIFWYGNIGTRLVKELLIFKWIKNLKKVTWIEIFMSAIVVVGGLIPMFFLQKGTPWNTIQFFYYSLFFSGILAGIAMTELENIFSASATKFIKMLIILLAIPTTIGTLRHYLPMRPPAMLPSGEQEALKFLSKASNGVVLAYPFDKEKAKAAEENPPRPLYLYESTAYVSAFGKKPTFLEDEVNLEITGYGWRERKEKVQEFFSTSDPGVARNFLEENKIAYIYLTEDQKIVVDTEKLGVSKIFENSRATVLKVE
ncbi:hypothetical protein HY502_01395 [Candidatus Woesebacteria bacterium]|nr:hypothetical protein [Candidatus Woesebacteria bacterium]